MQSIRQSVTAREHDEASVDKAGQFKTDVSSSDSVQVIQFR